MRVELGRPYATSLIGSSETRTVNARLLNRGVDRVVLKKEAEGRLKQDLDKDF